ncbi:N-acetyltransferase [Candidatus Sumerlaeota bacterium]|nr:N-acetyltransferase [Candidatus Sumerlaeota bacterium]
MIDPTAIIHPSACVDEPCIIGAKTRVWHFCHVREESNIGPNCQLGQGCYVGRGVKIGSGSKLQNNVSIYEEVTLEEEVFCGPSCVFTNVMNPRAAIERKHEFRPTLVRRGATIGANATILCGTTIGRWALIGAGAFVRADVQDFAVVVGVPARRIGWVSINGDTLPSLLVGDVYTCPHDGSKYRLARANHLELITPEPAVRQ